MAKYTSELVEGIHKISRDDKHIADFNPADETITYVTDDLVKYAVPVAKVIKGIQSGAVDPEPQAEALEVQNKRLKAQLQSRELTIVRLRDELAKQKEITNIKGRKKPLRFADDFDDSKAPLQDPNLGDLTPEYLEWARKNMPKEIFEKRYKGRISE